jgi:hypothetical protein
VLALVAVTVKVDELPAVMEEGLALTPTVGALVVLLFTVRLIVV